MPGSPTATAPSAVGAWTRRLHALLTTALVLGVLASLTRLIADVILALPTAKADYGFTGLWPSHASVSLDGALAPGVRAVDVMIEATLYDPARAPLLAALHLLAWLPGALVMLLPLFWLVRITSRGVAGDRALFSADTVQDLRRIGAILTLGSLAACALDFAAKTAAARMMTINAYLVPGDVDWPLVAVLMGVGAFVVAEVIGRGLAMLDEIEGTI
ncbi:DUF2975 family protein [Nonomuraea polychroma]|uniref:DUF2975 family protein n=1 Tax=Nonomuraea polychroma TaxID=46176 RepID=A0A438M643_9ACTN|nr:DUF2975 domain-containing protein [Nonomuraea polychroma]RVX40933.1 DUF2975 family protein [Nonomuraea polychroma]